MTEDKVFCQAQHTAAALQVIHSPETAGTLFHPDRRRILEALAGPDSASGVARLELPRQTVNYHLRELESAGLVEFIEQRPKGNCLERIVQAAAKAYVISPEALGSLGVSAQSQDQFSAAAAVLAASRTIRDIAILRARANAAKKKLATLTLETELTFESAAARASFTQDLLAAVSRLAARYNAKSGRRFPPPTCRSPRAHHQRTVGARCRPYGVAYAPSHPLPRDQNRNCRLGRRGLARPHRSPGTGPLVGGEFLADWGPGIAWRTTCELFDAPRHLRLVETRSQVLTSAAYAAELTPARLIQDFYVESAGGKVTVRLIHLGFGDSTEWDGEFEGARNGWRACFPRLQHTLERHRGEPVDNFIVPAVYPGANAASLLKKARAAAPAGTQIVFEGATEFAGMIPSWNGSILTVSAQQLPESAVVYIEFLLYNLPPSQVTAAKVHWQGLATEGFPDTLYSASA
ncbi:MAG: helix-turn-helix domain-containing protein [Acidobacteria bacterium]|nr:helix-turn-helix domain-containing protein [Acidobacteriota bacterium]